MNNWTNWINVTVIGLSGLAILSAEPIYRVDLYQYSFNIIYWMQQTLNNATFKYAMQLLSLLGGQGLPIFNVLIAYFFYSRQRALYYTASTFLLMYIVSLMKLYY
jgi:hypothetical protein